MKRELVPSTNPYFYHTGCYSVFARVVFNLLADIGKPHIHSTDHYLKLIKKNGKVITDECYCSLDITLANIGRCRALDNELLLTSEYKTKKFTPEVSRRFKTLLEDNVNILINSIAEYVNDEDEPFYIVPLTQSNSFLKFVKSPDSMYENTDLKRLKAEEYFTIKRLKKIIKPATTERLEDQFALSQKEVLVKELLNSIGIVEERLFNLLFKDSLPTQVSIFLPLYTDRLSLALHNKAYNDIGDALKSRLQYIPTSADDRKKATKAINAVINTDEYKYLIDMFYEVDKVSSVWWLMNDFAYMTKKG